jgi:predicted AAA+ superfamily ATPase
MRRLLYKELLSWKAAGMSKPLMVLGARQVGKTYLVDEFCKNEFPTYKTVSLLEDPLFVQIFASSLDSEAKLQQMLLHIGAGIDSPDSILFVDEVQESEQFISFLKFLQEKHPEINLICSGSLLGVRLKRLTSSYPVGKVQTKTLYPMSFVEFCQAIGHEGYVDEIASHYNSDAPVLSALHEKLMMLYKTYCCVGGMPEAVSQYLSVDGRLDRLDRSFFDDLEQAYLDDMHKYVKSASESLKIQRVYRSVPTQLGNSAAKFQYAKVASGARALHYQTAVDWLLSANLLYKSSMASTPQKPLKYFIDDDIFKLYLNDMGIMMHSLGIGFDDFILGDIAQAKGLIAETFVACELAANRHQLFYWRSQNSAEVDFLLEGASGIMPVEVKAGDNVRAKSLNIYRDKYAPNLAVRLSSKNFGSDQGIKSVPLYATFCLAATTAAQ